MGVLRIPLLLSATVAIVAVAAILPRPRIRANSTINSEGGRKAMWDFLQKNAMSPKPAWELGEWADKCGVGLMSDCESGFQTVWYNKQAQEWIHTNKLASSRGLYSMLKGSQTTPAQVPPPRDGASIVKEIWEFVGPIYPDQGAADPGTKWKLRLYSFDDFVGHPPTLGPVSGWSSNTSLNLDLPAHPTAQTVSTQDCPLTPGQALAQPANSRPAVFPGCFLNRFFPVCLVAGDTLLSNPSSEAFPTEPCIAILVGFHVMEWQDGAWNWGTFWWTADHGKGLTSLQDFKADDGRPTQLPIRYQFFSMMEEDGASTIERSLEDSYTHFYNPYFEGSFDENGTQTNCQSCHARSSYVPKADIAPFASSGSFSSNHNGERDCSTAQTAAPAANRCVLHTGWSWSIADAADAKFNFLLKVRHEAAAKVQQFQDQ